MTPEMEVLKARLKARCMASAYGHFATYLPPGAVATRGETPIHTLTSALSLNTGFSDGQDREVFGLYEQRSGIGSRGQEDN